MLSRTRSQRGGLLCSRALGRRAWMVGLLAAAWLLALGLLGGDAFAAQPRVGLGAADSFAVLAGQSVSNSGSSTVNGDLGVSPGTAVTGFPPGTLNGKLHSADAVAAQAQSDLRTAYDDASGRTPAVSLPADLGGLTLTPGVYKSASSSFALNGGLTLNAQGDPNAVFILQAASTLTTASASHVNLLNGAQSCNVFWQIGSSATLGASSVFAGDILAFTSISISDGVAMNGRALARNGAVTLSNDTITAAHCATPAGRTPGAPPGAPQHPRHGTTGGRHGTTGGRHAPRGTPGRGTNNHRRAVGFCVPNQTPTRTRARRPRHARSATTARRSRPVTHAGTRRPARPHLLSPRRRARVHAGIVRFSWRPAARAAGYTLMVDRHHMNTGCLTSATMRIPAGSHSWRVIARNRYGAHSSRVRAFSAGARAPSPQTALRQKAERDLRVAGNDLRQAVAAVVASHGNYLTLISVQTERAALALAIIEAKRAGLRGSAQRYQRLLDGETRRVDQAVAIQKAASNPNVQAILAFVEQLGVDAAVEAGAHGQKEVDRFISEHRSDIFRAAELEERYHKVNRGGAKLIAQGVKNPKLTRLIEQLYKYTATEGDGSTMYALISEAKAGCVRHACGHYIKAVERRDGLVKILGQRDLTATERRIAGDLVSYLNRAIARAGG